MSACALFICLCMCESLQGSSHTLQVERGGGDICDKKVINGEEIIGSGRQAKERKKKFVN